MDQIMEGHNMAREAVGVPPLVWEQNLATYAKAYLEYRRHDCKLIYLSLTLSAKISLLVQGSLLRMLSTLGLPKNNAGKDCSDYTQVVWRTTIRVGCGQIKCDGGDIFTACEYYPPGNYVGAKPY
ncbi:Allergen V5/Tpx-1-related [Macleaya cordata]|uniref:Allergen V5/Tpx-1-related n=1 Tax=Macleaya cordata TaxID=56857 RepID=A0A200QRE3_MACCD|nr:Allergen V5/Tpx-1-related [Macleaya cordata]